jgi:LuxR family transcriptional regulator, maltose regulon positive regulatory protein
MPKPAGKTHAGPTQPLLLSKLSAPVGSRYRLARPRIAERVFNAYGIRLVLVRAPAGFGKTTAMLQLRDRYEQEGTACAWLNLDEADNDPPRFLTYFGLALRSVLDAAPGDGDLVERRNASAGELAMLLMDRIQRHRAPFVVFFDEFEVLHNPAVLELIAQGIERLPQGAQIVIGSRRVPEIGLGRLRARGQLLEIDPAQLRFSAEEAGEFLNRQRGLSIKHEQVERLHRSTEGWVAALWLASVALERRQDVDAFIAGFSGSNAEVADYLAEDVLASQSSDLREFLLHTCVLEVLTPALCDAVRERNDSAEMIGQIERANLFLSPIDEAHSGWRYHSLFSSFLRETLLRTHPELPPLLHRRAAECYLRDARPIPAINHAFASGDIAYAMRLLTEEADALLGRGRLRLLTKWLDALPVGELARHPRLRAIHAWAVNFTRGPRETLRLMEGVAPEALDDLEAAAQWAALRLMALAMSDRIDDAHNAGLDCAPQLKVASPFAYGMLAQTLANTHMILGRFSEARYYADEARRALAERESDFLSAQSEAVEAAIDLMQGRLREATIRLRAACGSEGSGVGRNVFPGVLLAEALYEAGDLETAERMLSVFAPMVRDLGLADHLIDAHVLLARLLGERGEVEGALKTLADLESSGHRLALPRAVGCARLERARRLIAQGDFLGAREQIDRVGEAPQWDSVSPRHFVANDLSNPALARLRWQIRSGAAQEAITSLKVALENADFEHRHRRALKLRILLAEALHTAGQRKSALRTLGRALEIAAIEGFVSMFLDEGPAMRGLLGEYFQAREIEVHGLVHDHLRLIMERVSPSRSSAVAGSTGVSGTLNDPLTRKEIEVMELLAQGYSNNAMAEKLFVSETTVRTHLRNINVKLQAGSRTQAIVIARRLRIVS